MKKIISTILASALALSLCACSSSRLDDLERRVSALEEKTETTTQQTIKDTTQSIIQNTSEMISEETTITAEGSTYDLSNMSADEIVNEIFYYVDNRPQQGDTYEAIQERFKIAPETVNILDSGIQSSFNLQYPTNNISYDADSISINQDQIIYVNYSNAQKAMNGSTVDVNNNTFGVYVAFGIVDYTKAEEVFTAIGNYFNSDNSFTNVNIYRDNGNQWSITFDVVTDNGSYGGSSDCVSMIQAQNGYIFEVNIR